MQDLITALEDNAIATWVRESPSIFAYTTVLSLHAMGLAIVVGVSLVIALRMLGVLRTVPLASVLRLYPLMYIGFTINAVSGLMLFAANAGSLLSNVAFIVKLVLIVIAMIVMELLRSRAADAPQEPGRRPPASLRIIGVIAIAAWGLAIITGRLTAYPYFLSALFSS